MHLHCWLSAINLLVLLIRFLSALAFLYTHFLTTHKHKLLLHHFIYIFITNLLFTQIQFYFPSPFTPFFCSFYPFPFLSTVFFLSYTVHKLLTPLYSIKLIWYAILIIFNGSVDLTLFIFTYFVFNFSVCFRSLQFGFTVDQNLLNFQHSLL